MSLSAYERESAINFTDFDKSAMFYTCNRSWITKLDKLCVQFPDTYKLKREIKIDGEVCGKEYTLPKNLISLRSPREKRELTEEQTEKLRERGRKLAEARKLHKEVNSDEC